MAATSKGKSAKPPELPADWDAVVRQAVQASPGMKASAPAMKKALPASQQKLAKQALQLALELAELGELFFYKKQQLFIRDPLLDLDALILDKVSTEPLPLEELKSLAGPYGGALDAWLKRAIDSKKLYEWQLAGAGKSKKKAYARVPDARGALKGVLKALKTALLKTARVGISNEQVARVLLSELGVGGPGIAPNGHGTDVRGNGKRGLLLGALDGLVKERPRDALLLVGDLRARVDLGKDEFDALALELMREGAISLHHHDHPAGLTEAERAQLVKDARGTFYIGIAPRSGA